MILVLAVAAGLAAGLIRARLGKRQIQVTNLHAVWLLILAILPQWLAFSFPITRSVLTLTIVKVLFVSSQVLLLAFILINVRKPGMWLIGAGLVSNLLVIVANGGLMPISPRTVGQIYPNAPTESIETGTRLGWTKDIILEVDDTKIAWLSDRFVTPELFSTRYAFSTGDVLIAAGAFWLLWTLGGPVKDK
jgi:hypothetical protein